MSGDIANESGTGVDEVALAAVARHVLGELHIKPLAELSVLLVDKNVMTGLHERWMGEPGPADVLAFPMDELRPPVPPHLSGARGDRGAGRARFQPGAARRRRAVPAGGGGAGPGGAGTAWQDELELLCTHGLLHLLGYDHAEPDERATMFSLQEQLLASWRASKQRGTDVEGRKGPG